MPPPIIAVEVNSVKANRQIKSIKKNIADLRTMVDGLSQSVKQVDFSKMGKGATANLKNLSRASQQASGTQRKLSKSLKATGGAANKAGKQLKGTKGRVTELSKSIQIALGPLSGVAARLTAFSSLATGASFVIAGLVVSV
ncbi:hypothetical protein LCGC14_2136940, partial [marine sediment metagenome]